MIVTVNAPICRVIRIRPTPFRVMWANRLPFDALLPRILYQKAENLSMKPRHPPPHRPDILQAGGAFGAGVGGDLGKVRGHDPALDGEEGAVPEGPGEEDQLCLAVQPAQAQMMAMGLATAGSPLRKR